MLSGSRLRALSWTLAVLCFVVGFYVGWSVHAQTGAVLWLLSAVFGLLPFLSHREFPGAAPGNRPPTSTRTKANPKRGGGR